MFSGRLKMTQKLKVTFEPISTFGNHHKIVDGHFDEIDQSMYPRNTTTNHPYRH